MSHPRWIVPFWGVMLSVLSVSGLRANEPQGGLYQTTPASDLTAYQNPDYLREYSYRHQQVGHFPGEQLPEANVLFRTGSDVPVIDISTPPPAPPLMGKPSGESGVTGRDASDYAPYRYDPTERVAQQPGELPYYEDVSVEAYGDGEPSGWSSWLGCSPDYCYTGGPWTWTLLPRDLLWQSYVGGPREPRFSQSIVHLKGTGTLWELQAGGRVGVLRYGSGPGEPLEGFQVDLWGTAFPRLNISRESELEAVDFVVGVPLTWRQGQWQLKLEWYHVSAHLGDEFLLRPENAGYNRLDYLRDAIVLGVGYYATPDWRFYAEADYAYNVNDGAKPWHFQFGFDYAPVRATPITQPDFFFAVNGTMREEVNWSGGINVVAGVQGRGDETQHALRTGLHYYQGQSLQYSFLGDYEEFIGWGLWYDF